MKSQLNELVQKLTSKHEIECVRPTKSVQSLKDCVERNYVHVMFKETQTELGVQLNRKECDFSEADFDNARGHIRVVGGLTLNYNKVKCVADIDLATCEGSGYLVPVSDEEYEILMGRKHTS